MSGYYEGHAPVCGHVIAARATAMADVLKGFIEADAALPEPWIPEGTRKWLLSLVELQNGSIKEYYETWGEPTVEQLLDGIKYMAQRGE